MCRPRGCSFFTFIATPDGLLHLVRRRLQQRKDRVVGAKPGALQPPGARLHAGEISYILLGELGLITLIAIPLGFLIGYWLCAYIAQALASDLFRVPLVIETKTYALAAAVVLASASVSGLIVRHKLDHLDLVEVLKTRE